MTVSEVGDLIGLILIAFITGLQRWLDAMQSAVTIAAIIVGGFWAWFGFLRHRKHWPKAEIMHLVTDRRLANSALLLRVGVRITNIGDVLFTGGHCLLRVQRVLPCSEEEVQHYSGQPKNDEPASQECGWPTLEERNICLRDIRIEPGESDTVFFDFIFQKEIHTVLIYSYVKNEERREADIGWSHVTFHDVEGSRISGEGLSAQQPTPTPGPLPPQGPPTPPPRPKPSQ